MASGPGIGRIRLGPVVGHTDHRSSRIWIQVSDDPRNYALRVQDAGTFPFASTEAPGALEFRTAMAVADGLRADWRYRYTVLRLDRPAARGRGSFRTMPDPLSMANLTFLAVSCNVEEGEGAWAALGKYIEDAQPQFLLMVGDQVYLDQGEINLFTPDMRKLSRADRRRAIAEKYQRNWSRQVVRDVLANIPVYMVWDDHDIRDGWGSEASDSPTLVARHPRGWRIFETCRDYYEDCRDAYWHFQACRNPRRVEGGDPALPNYVEGMPGPGQRGAMPYVFRCGRLVALVLDSRGDRDVFRSELPILGARQWRFIEDVFAGLPPEVDALAVVTSTPIASIDPDGPTMNMMGDRTDDVDAFKAGEATEALDAAPDNSAPQFVLTLLNAHWSRITSAVAGVQLNWGRFKIGNIDEARDQWSHKLSRPEQAALLRGVGAARLSNRPRPAPREVVFISGDIHVGARFTISCADPPYEAQSLTASGINTVFHEPPTVDVLLSDAFEVAPGIRSELQEVVTDFNFGIVEVVPTGAGAAIQAKLAHKGASIAIGVDLGLYL